MTKLKIETTNYCEASIPYCIQRLHIFCASNMSLVSVSATSGS